MRILSLFVAAYLFWSISVIAGVLDVVSAAQDLGSREFKKSVQAALAEGGVNDRDADGDTALLKLLKLYLPGMTSSLNDTDVLELLLDAGADCEVCGKEGMTPLVWATELCLIGPLKQIAAASSSIRAYNNAGQSLREIAAANDESGLFTNSGLVFQFVSNLEAPLMTAFDRSCYYARTGQTQLMKKWADSQAAHGRDENGRTLLHLATLSGKQDTINAALQLGCKGSALDFYFQKADGTPSEVKPLSAQHSHASLKERRDLPAAWYAWLNRRESDFIPPTFQSSTLLHFSRDLSVNQVQKLLELGLDPNEKDSLGYTPADYLLAWERSKTPLPLSVFDRLDRLNILMAYGARVDEATKQWDLSIQEAAIPAATLDPAKRYVISLLLDTGTQGNWQGTVSDELIHEIRNEQGKLLDAIRANNTEAVWHLLDTISPDFFQGGYTPLQQAILAKQEAMATILIRDGGLLSLLSTNKKTALGLAIEQGLNSLVREVCKKDITLASQPTYNESTKKCDAPLMLALSLQNTSALKVLLSYGVDRHIFDWNKDKALITAAQSDNLALCKLLLEEGASFVYQNESGNTALHEAKSAPVAALLLDAGAKINLPNHHGKTPLHRAAILQDPEVAQTLAARLAPLDMVSSDGYTPLLEAVTNSCIQTALTLIRQGASLTQLDLNGKTALMLAAERGLSQVISTLIAQNAPLNAADFSGNTALHLATQNSQAESAKLLLNAGCVPTLENLDGKTPLAIANSLGNKSIARAILAKTNTPTYLDWIYAITQIGIGVSLLGLATSLMAKSGSLLLKEKYSNYLLPAFLTPSRACLTAFTSSFLVASPNVYNFIGGAFWEKDRLETRSFLTGQSWAGLGSLSLMLALGFNLNPLHKILIGALGLWYFLGWPRFAKPWLVLFVGIGMGLLGASFIKSTAALLAGAPLITQAMDYASTSAPIAILIGVALTLFFQSSSSIGITIAAFSLTGVITAETILLCLGGGSLGSAFNGWLWSNNKDSHWNSVAHWVQVMSLGSASIIFCNWLIETYLHIPLAIALVEWAFSNLFLQQLGLVLVFGLLQATLLAIFFPTIFDFFDKRWYFYRSIPNDTPRFLPSSLPAEPSQILKPLEQEQNDLQERLLQYFAVKDQGGRTALKALEGQHRNFKRIFSACEEYISQAKATAVNAADLLAVSLRQRRIDILERSTYQVARFALTESCKNTRQWQDFGQKLLAGTTWQSEQIHLALAEQDPAERANLLCLLEQMEEDAKQLRT